MSYERSNIKKMKGYTPGEQPDNLEVVKLNTNENPYPPGKAILETLHSIEAMDLRRYPSPTAQAFRRVAADMHDVAPENIIATNGGDELIRLAFITFVDPKQIIGMTEPSYSLYPVLAAIQGSDIVRLPLQDDWSLPGDFANSLNRASVKLAIIVNPHAPSGFLTPVHELADIAERFKGVLIIDEAYVDFVDPELEHDAVQLVKEYDNIILLRSLSKGYSLAGLRFGYGLGAETLIEPMISKTKDSYNVNVVSQKLAVAALENRREAAWTWQAVRSERQRLSARLEDLDFKCPSSQSNFLLATVPGSIPGGARGIYETLKKQDIYIRYFDEDRLRDKLRITVGRPGENDALLAALKGMIGG